MEITNVVIYTGSNALESVDSFFNANHAEKFFENTLRRWLVEEGESEIEEIVEMALEDGYYQEQSGNFREIFILQSEVK